MKYSTIFFWSIKYLQKPIKLNKLFIAIIFCVATKSLAQTQRPDIGIPSPNAATLFLFNEIPISPFTGLPNIDIPIYSARQGSLNIPISLSYHASGIRPHQHPGWVGGNWNLNAGGIITRKIRDLMDDQYYVTFFSNSQTEYIPNAGFYYNYTVCNPTNWESDDYLRTLASDGRKSIKDTEPDEFNFNFLGYSGKFFLGDDGTWKVSSDDNIKVQFNAFINVPEYFVSGYSNLQDEEQHRNAQSFGGFTLITENGTKFIFGGSLNSIEFSLPHSGIPSWVANSWHLVKVIDTNGKEVNFTYQNDGYVVDIRKSLFDDYIRESGTGFFCEENWNGYPNRMTWNLIRPTFLSKIETSTEVVYFSRSNSVELRYSDASFNIVPSTIYDPNQSLNLNTELGSHLFWVRGFYAFYINPNRNLPITGQNLLNRIQWKKLDRIYVQDKSNNRISDFGLTYSNNFNQRLQLSSLQKIDGSSKVSYDFQYYDNPSFDLPNYETQSIDHWGFYNAKPNTPFSDGSGTSGQVTGNLQTYTDYYQEREPAEDIAILQEGTLKTIIYPTGGLSEFIFEPHSYSKIVEVDRTVVTTHTITKLAGGLRIKKILNRKNATSTEEGSREFLYVTDYLGGGTLSSGVLNGKTQYLIKEYDYSNSTTTYKRYFFSSNNALPYSINSLGSHINYTYVVEKLPDESFSIYKYTNHDLGFTDETVAIDLTYRNRMPYDAFNERIIERGKLLSLEKYTANDKPVEKIKYDYEKFSNDFVKSINTASIALICNQGANFQVGLLSGFPYRNYIYRYKIKKEDYELYDQEDPGNEAKKIINSFSYSYNPIGQGSPSSDLLVRKITQESSDGIKIITENKYVGDYPLIEDPIGQPAEGITYLKQNKIDNALIESITYFQRTENGVTTNYFAKGLLNRYKIFSNGKAYPWESYKLKFDMTGTFSSYNWSYMSGKSFLTDMSKFKLQIAFDNYDNYGNLITSVGEDGVSVNYTWGYDNSILTSRTFNSESGALQHRTSYVHSPLIGVTQITDPNNLNTHYVYDGLRRLKVVKDHNNHITARYRYNFENDADNDVMFTYSTYSSSSTSNSIQFTAQGTGEAGTSLIWDFGNGTVLENAQPSPLVVYYTPGLYTVKLASKHPEYPTAVSTKLIRILPPANAQITAPGTGTVRTVCGAHTTTCTVTIDGGPYLYQWEYNYSASGSGTFLPIGTNSNTLNFTMGGVQSSSHSIRCKITDEEGNSRYSNYITIFHYCSGSPGGQGDCPSGWTWNPTLGRCDPPAGHCGEGCFWTGTQCACQ